MSYTNNPTSILAGSGIVVTPVTGTGANTITISTAAAGLLAVRIAVATPDTVLGTDAVVSYEVPGPVPVAVTLPAGITGTLYYLKDGLGLASVATPITITPTAGTIDGAPTAVINVPFGALTVVYNGTQWIIL